MKSWNANLNSIPLAVRCQAEQEQEQEAEKYLMQEGFKKVWRNQFSVKF
jgi:hypothetical protein